MGEWWILVVKSSTTSWVQWVKAEVVGFDSKVVETYHTLLACSGRCVSDEWGISNLADSLLSSMGPES